MKNFFICLAFLVGFSVCSFAQTGTVVMDYQHSDFNDNRPLPAEEYFVIKGPVNPGINMVRVCIINNRHERDTLYSNVWRRPFGNRDNSFNVPVRYKLRGNDQYNFVFTFYRALSDSERVRFAAAVRNNLEAYIKSALEANRSGFTLHSSANRMLKDMDRIVMGAFTYYRNGLTGPFPGFSDMIKTKLKQLNDARLRNARYNIQSKEKDNRTDVRRRYATQLRQELLAMAMNEVTPYINSNLVIFQDKRQMKDYPTEKTRAVLAVNAGYGGVYLSGNWGDLHYDAQPYAGVSFPLGNRHFSRFMGNTSVSVGIFLRDLKGEKDNKITGPVIGKPFYLGLGYKVFQFIRINAGLVVTSMEKGTLHDIRSEDVKLRPFAGLSAELNLWLGTGR